MYKSFHDIDSLMTDIKVILVALSSLLLGGDTIKNVVLMDLESVTWIEFTKGILTLVVMVAAAVYGVFRSVEKYYQAKSAKYESEASQYTFETFKEEEEKIRGKRDGQKN